jgi:hypothetical protein
MRSTRPITFPTLAVGCANTPPKTCLKTAACLRSRCDRCARWRPELASLDAKRKLVQKIEGAISEAYTGVANFDEVLVLINHYPLRNVGWRHSLQSDKPEIVAAVDQLNAKVG